MKRIFAMILSAVLLLSLATSALGTAADVRRSTQKLSVDGTAVDCAADNIDGYNYVELRTLAELLKETECRFDVDYDAGTDSVVITRGAAYDGGKETDDGADASATAVPSAQTVIVDGVRDSGLRVWNIGGSNWFKLAELAELIGFRLGYNAAAGTVEIETGRTAQSAGDYAAVLAALGNAGGSAGVISKGTRNDEASVAEEPAAPAPAAESASKNSASDYSGTNVQVDGVDEGDIVKTDGRYLYVLRSEELTILKADGADTAVVSRTKIGYYSDDSGENGKEGRYRSEWKSPAEMFVNDGRLCVISSYNRYDSGTVDGVWRDNSESYACVDLYDVTDPAEPKALASLGQDGSVLGSRMADGKVYLITSYWVWNWEEDEPITYIPGIYRNGAKRLLPADDVRIVPGCSSTQYVVACEYDLAGGACSAAQSLLGAGDRLYMNDSGVYVMGSRWRDDVTRTYRESVYSVEEHHSYSETEIWRFSPADGLKPTADGRVPGYLDSQFSVDEYDGFLRLVTTSDDSVYRVYTDEEYEFTNYRWEPQKQSTGLYVLDGELDVVGRVDDLAPGERVYSARFDGTIAYFCTFRNVDPLFAVDVSVPTAPKVLSALKISGFSEYLHPWSSGRLFGFGREADEESGWSEQLKLVMFNTENKTDVTVKHTLLVDDCWYSEALYDHRAFFIDGAKNIIGFVGDGDYYIYSFDDASGFRRMCSFSFDVWPGSIRGFWIGENAYIVGQHVVQVLSLNGWNRLLTLKLDAE